MILWTGNVNIYYTISEVDMHIILLCRKLIKCCKIKSGQTPLKSLGTMCVITAKGTIRTWKCFK